MSAITLEVPDDVASLLVEHEAQLPEILERVIRSLAEGEPAFHPGKYEGSGEIFEFLASLPTPEEILQLKASDKLAERSSELLEKSRNEGLSPAEEEEMDHYETLQHLVGMAKIRATAKLGVGSVQRHA